MAEIVFLEGRRRAVQIPGMEAFNDTCKAASDVVKCEMVQGDDNGVTQNEAPYPVGVALESARAGEYFGVGTHCEIAGFDNSTTTAHELVYPSALIEGGLATGAEKKVGSTPCGRISSDNKRIKILTF